MSESSGLDASTVHSALGWIPGQGPTVDELETDLLIVDETSMANLELLVTVLRAVGPRTHVVLVGDADQLAPVGAGKPFAELVEAKPVPIAELTHIFRQAAGSMIVRGAHAVRHGDPPSFTATEGMTRDLFLIERDDPRAALDEVVTLVTERLPKHFGVDSLTDIQVFAPVYRGALGIDALNARLRETLNPTGRPVLGGRLRVGDKLMLSGRNLHDLGLMNGTILRLLDHNEDDEALVVEADGIVVHLPEEEAPKLQLAYACSIHKGQGIELPVAIVIAHAAAGAYFLRREMLYTAMTRARLATLDRWTVGGGGASGGDAGYFAAVFALGSGSVPDRTTAPAPPAWETQVHKAVRQTFERPGQSHVSNLADGCGGQAFRHPNLPRKKAMMFSTTFKRPFATLAVVSGLLIAAAPASAGSHQAATDETPNSLTNAVVADSDRRQTPSGFSWSESQTGLVKTADVQGGAADANGFLVDGPFSVKPASGFSWSETQTGFADSAGGHSGSTATRTGTQSP